MSSEKRSISPNTLESEVPPLNRIFGETVRYTLGDERSKIILKTLEFAWNAARRGRANQEVDKDTPISGVEFPRLAYFATILVFCGRKAGASKTLGNLRVALFFKQPERQAEIKIHGPRVGHCFVCRIRNKEARD